MLGLYTNVAGRIVTRCPSVLQVETGMEPEAALAMLALGSDVTALVSPLSDTAPPIREAGMMVSQQTTHRFGVTMALVAPGGFAQFEPSREEIKATLRGWMPPGASTPIQYAGGRTLSYSLDQHGGRWLHLLTFTVTQQESYGVQA